MIFNDTIFTENGDEIVFQSTPIYGLDSIDSFSDSITGQTSKSFLIKSFAISTDGVVYTEFFPLSNQSLAAQINNILSAKTTLIIKFKYTLSSTETNPQVELVSLSLNGTYSQKPINFPISSRSIYKDLVYDNINVWNLMVNLTEKLYERGVLPEYLTRGEIENDIFEDKDFIEFWSTVAKFFSVFLIDAFKFTKIYFDYILLSEFLDQKGIFFTKANGLIDLQLIASNFYDEIRSRGTSDIFKPKGFEYPVGRRNSYAIPSSYVIAPSTPVIIDGRVYKEVTDLPFGWTVQNNGLVAPDLDYHRIVFGTEDDGSYISSPPAITLLPANIQSQIFKQYDGEYLRLIGYNSQVDEFIYNQVDLRFLGWFVNTSSPLYKGLRAQYSPTLIKGYETSQDFFDLDNYPVI